MDSTEKYADFLKKVERTIYIDNLSPEVKKNVIKVAFDQFGNVQNVEFIPLFMQPDGAPRAALVEMEDSKQAQEILIDMTSRPFMIGGMPRPVRAKAARVEMFDNRPRKPGRVIRCQWLDNREPDFKVAQNIKTMLKRHAAEASFLFENQLAEEKKLNQQHAQALRTNHKKLELIEGFVDDGSADRLAKHYGLTG